MMGAPVDMKDLFAELRDLEFPAAFQGPLEILERDERMPEVWQNLTSKGYTRDNVAPLVRAILQIKDLANDPLALPRKLRSLEAAAKNARALADFYQQDPTGSDEREKATEASQVLRLRYDTLKSAAEQILPTTQLDSAGVFSTILSRVLVQNFERPLDDLVATITTVLFKLPEPLEPNTVGTRRRREEKRRACEGK